MKSKIVSAAVFVLIALAVGISWGCPCWKNQASGRLLNDCPCPVTERDIREKNRDLLKQHIIAIDQDGNGLDPVELTPVKDTGAYSGILRSIIDSAVLGVRSGQYDRIVFFIHGGLNTFSSSIGRAISLTGEMGKDTVDRAYPIFIIWKSGPFSTYWEHLWKIRQGRVLDYMPANLITAPIVFTTDVVTGLARSPMVVLANMWTDLKSGLPGSDANPDSIYCELRRQEGPGVKSMDIDKGDDARKRWDKIGKGTNYFLTLPLRWGSAPVIDAFGTPDWNIMLRRTGTLFRTNDEFDIRTIRRDSAALRQHMHSRPTGALWKAMKALKNKVDDGSGIRIDLIGHSMGAIVANQILLNFQEIKFANIVYMAAACKVRDFNEYVVPYLKAHSAKDTAHSAKTRFYNLTLHPIAERRETNIALMGVDFFQRGSLLEWIDNFFSRPNNTEERTLGKYENVYQCIHMIPEQFRPQITIKTFGVGRISPKVPQTHGSFTEYPFWRHAFWQNRQPSDTTLIHHIPDSSSYRL